MGWARTFAAFLALSLAVGVSATAQDCDFEHGPVLNETSFGENLESNIDLGYFQEMSAASAEVRDLGRFVGLIQTCFWSGGDTTVTIGRTSYPPVVVAPCTGTLIDDSLIITAYHCYFPSPYYEAGYRAVESRITFGFDDGETPDRNKLTLRLDLEPVRETEQFDAMLLRFRGAEDRPTDWINELVTSRFADHGSRFAELQAFPITAGFVLSPLDDLQILGHPDGAQRLLSVRGCKVFNELPGEEEENRVFHTCATEGGSSGALILDDTFNVVGVHTSGGLRANLPLSTFNKGWAFDRIAPALGIEFGRLQLTENQCQSSYLERKLSNDLAGLEEILGECEGYAIGALITEEIDLLGESMRPKHGDVIFDPIGGSFVYLEGGNFMMGSPQDEFGRRDSEDTQSGSGGSQLSVTVRPFMMGQYEVTLGAFSRFVRQTGYNVGGMCWTRENGYWEERSGRNWENPGFRQGYSHPVVCVNWTDAQEYVAWLNSKVDGNPYGLASEAQWEYAARAGTRSAYSTGASISSSQANFDLNVGRTVEGSMYEPNLFNLYNMHGNAWEWVQDCYEDHLRAGIRSGSTYQPEECLSHVLRGGSWNHGSQFLRSAYRNTLPSTSRSSVSGFRIIKAL